jgi:hypothetical protein
VLHTAPSPRAMQDYGTQLRCARVGHALLKCISVKAVHRSSMLERRITHVLTSVTVPGLILGDKEAFTHTAFGITYIISKAS